MNVDGLELPLRLVRLIASGQWPRTERDMNRLQGDARLAAEVVRRVRSTETSLVLYPTPFATVHRRVASGDRWWLEPSAAPRDLDPRLAVPIGDFGLGSDAPIVLDYRVDRARPRVLGLRWRERETANGWEPIAESFDEFCDRLELEANLPVFARAGTNAERRIMLDLLRLLADPEAQRAYERNVPIAQVPAELLCLWFDDHYHPDSSAFREAFDPVELAALARFHAVFTEVADRMPERLERVAELHAWREWSVVVQAAARVLTQIRERDDAGNRG